MRQHKLQDNLLHLLKGLCDYGTNTCEELHMHKQDASTRGVNTLKGIHTYKQDPSVECEITYQDEARVHSIDEMTQVTNEISSDGSELLIGESDHTTSQENLENSQIKEAVRSSIQARRGG